MSRTIREVSYFYTTVRDRPGEAYRLLSLLAESGVNLLAFNAVPAGLEQTQLVLFPEQPEQLRRTAEGGGIELFGPHRALMIQGDDRLGALAEIHRTLSDSGVNVSSASGLADGSGGYGYVLYFRQSDLPIAARALGL